jgi:oligopeptide transport system substrate-binding protein
MTRLQGRCISVRDVQTELLERRLHAVGIGRREVLKILVGVAGAAWSSRGRRVNAQVAPGERLARQQVIRLGGGGYFDRDPSSHDFGKMTVGGSGHAALFAGLLQLDPDFTPVPDLATRVEPNRDGSRWTFYLRTDSRWSDGAPCTAHDFVWSWRRVLDPATRAPYSAFFYDIRNAEAFNKGQVTDPALVGLRARDDVTLEVTLEGPRAYFPALTAFLAALPAYRPAVEKHGDAWTEPGNIVSNGPFRLESWDHGREFVLTRNAHYHGAGNIRLERAIVKIIPIASGFLPYENDEVDFTLVPSGDLPRARTDPKLGREVFRYSRPQTWYLTLQVTKPPFDNLAVRRAVAQAIDREAVASVTQGSGIPAHSMVPPGMPGHIVDPAIQEIQRFDPKAAMLALKGTPFEGGKGWPHVVIAMRGYAEAAKPMIEAIQAMLLEHLNLKSELSVLEPRVFYERMWKHDFQAMWVRWSIDYPDPHNEYFDPFYGKGTMGRRQAWVNDEFDRTLEAARGELDRQKRLALYRKAEGIIQRDVGYVPVVWGTPYAAFKPWVRGVKKNRDGEVVVDANVYTRMLTHLYVVERS